MTAFRPDDTDEKLRAPLSVLPFGRDDIARVAGALGLVLAGFSFMGSVALWVYTQRNPELDAIQLPGGLLLRTALFGVACVLCLALIGCARCREALPRPVWSTKPVPRGAWCLLAALLAGMVLLLSVKIDEYPWAAPDEVHHLVVARNLAEYGSYASGHPDAGFRFFDSFDSVGPAVLGPVAAAFKCFGVSLAAARAVLVVFFLLLCAGAFLFVRERHGPWAGIAAVCLLFGTFSSIYLGRTLYGEVPALAYLLFGLLAWQRALARPGWSGWGMLAGVLVAGAVLSKTILLLVAFSFAGAWVYDRVTFRQIRWPHVVMPAAGGLGVLGVWAVFQRLHGTGPTESGGVLAIYQHYLLFGLSSVPEALANSVARNPVAHAAWLGVAILTIPLVFRHRYQPAAVVLYSYALFCLYWWFFFTPGQLHRYLWTGYAILALFAAPWLVAAIAAARDQHRATLVRVVCAVAAVVLAGPSARWVALQAREIATKQEMASERAIVRAITALPGSYRIATTSGRLPGLVNFFGDRVIETGADPGALLETYDVVVLPDTAGHRAVVPSGASLKSAGDFVLLSTRRSLKK